MTEDQITKAQALSRCRFLPGSNAKRFVRDMARLASEKPDQELTERQRKYLDDLFHSYRRQIGRAYLEILGQKSLEL